MGALAITIIVAAGLVIGFGVQYLTKPRSALDWLFIAVATVVGAVLGSEVLSNNVLQLIAGGPQIDGLVIVPAVATGLVLGVVADAVVRYVALEPA